ncbi:protein-L-isoaspartate O-methyltransferase 1-like [Diaphorina citri]|nr:protein-L-isoaspartate O-methyltransferase 1-like [Diaphorina citri]
MSHEKYPVLTLLDIPHNIGHNAFMESPSDHCLVLELLSGHLKYGDKVLEIGTGSGYLTTLFGAMVGISGKVYTIEHIPELLEAARKRVKAKAETYIKRINFYVGQGKNGLQKEAPYSAIYVSGSVDNIPIELIKQLKPGGRLLVPIKSDPKEDPILTIIDRYMNNTVVTTEVQCVFIEPLRELQEQRSLNRTWENDLIDEFDRNTPPTRSVEDFKNYTGWYHTDKYFKGLYELVNARPNLFTMEFDPKMYKIIGTKPKPTFDTEEPIKY